jgi:hypothetical protein
VREGLSRFTHGISSERVTNRIKKKTEEEIFQLTNATDRIYQRQRRIRVSHQEGPRFMSRQSAYLVLAAKGGALDGARALMPAGMGSRHRFGLDSCTISGVTGLVRQRTNPETTPGDGSADVEVLHR